MDPAVVTGTTAVATGVLGYLGALLQHRGEEARVQVEHERLRLDQRRAESETAHIAAQRLDQQMERRRLLYSEFLAVTDKAWTLSTRHEPVQGEDLDAWWIAYQGVRRQLKIGAASAVVTAHQAVTEALVALFGDLVKAVAEEDPEAAWHARGAAWVTHHEAVEGAQLALEAEMRSDLDVAE